MQISQDGISELYRTPIEIRVTRKPFQVQSYRNGTEVVCLLGIFPGGQSKLWDLVQVGDIGSILLDMIDDPSNESDIEDARLTSLYRAIASVWSAGCHNIQIVNIGKQSEFDGLSKDDYHDLMFDRTGGGLYVSTNESIASIIVPVDAVAEGYLKTTGDFVDYLEQSANAAASAMSSGNFVQVVLSTGTSDVTLLTNSESIRRKEDWQFRDPDKSFCYSQTLGWIPTNDKYRFVAVPAGRAVQTYTSIGVGYLGGLAPAVAGLMGSLASGISLAGRILDNVSHENVLSDPVDIQDLIDAGYIPFGDNASIRRHRIFGSLILADPTMSINVSDYKQEAVLRLARRASMALQLAIEPYIGTNGIGIETAVTQTLTNLANSGVLKGNTVKFSRDPDDPYHSLRIFVQLEPYLPTKLISIELVAGPFVL